MYTHLFKTVDEQSGTTKEVALSIDEEMSPTWHVHLAKYLDFLVATGYLISEDKRAEIFDAAVNNTIFKDKCFDDCR